MFDETQDNGGRSLPRYDIEPPPPFPPELSGVSPRQLRDERQSESGSPLPSKKPYESFISYPLPASPISSLTLFSYAHCWHCVGHKSRTVKVAKSYLAGTPVERTGVLGRAGRERCSCSVLRPLIVATICQLCCYRKGVGVMRMFRSSLLTLYTLLALRRPQVKNRKSCQILLSRYAC